MLMLGESLDLLVRMVYYLGDGNEGKKAEHVQISTE